MPISYSSAAKCYALVVAVIAGAAVLPERHQENRIHAPGQGVLRQSEYDQFRQAGSEDHDRLGQDRG